jgi:hypothetical protein
MESGNILDKITKALVLSMLATGTGAGAYLGIRYLIRKSRSNNINDKSLNEGDPSTYARQLQMALQHFWGADLEVIYQVFNAIPSNAAYAKVQKAYSAITSGKNLNADLAGGLSSSEYQKVIDTLNSKPDGKRDSRYDKAIEKIKSMRNGKAEAGT